MPRRKGFRQEDYELTEAINEATDGRLRPSEACDLAEKWALIKLRRRAQTMWDAGHYDASRELYNVCTLLEAGEM